MLARTSRRSLRRVGRSAPSTSPSSSSVTATIPTGEARDPSATRQKAGGEAFSVDEVKARHYKLDAFKWIRDEELDDPDDLPEPGELITSAMEELQLALDELNDLQRLLEGSSGGAEA